MPSEFSWPLFGGGTLDPGSPPVTSSPPGTYARMLEERGPRWLRQPHGQRYLNGAGDVLDGLFPRTKEAVKARFPEMAPEDALAAIGTERGMERGPTESADAFAARLLDAWETWPWAGTPYGMLRALRAAGYVNASIRIVNGKSYALDASGALVITAEPVGGWCIEATPAFWSKFEVLLVPTHPAWWSGIPADGSPEADTVRRIIRKWKPGHATLKRIIVYTAGELWGYPAGTWGAPGGTWGSATVTYWSP